MSNVFDKNNYHVNIYTIARFNHIRQLSKDLKYSWQRITKGYSDYDVWDIREWFKEIVPCMVQELKETRISSPDVPTTEDGKDYNQQWDEKLDEIVFAFREAREETCSKQNRYSEEWSKANKEFEKKYGLLGEKLQTDEEKAKAKKEGLYTMHMMREIPKYKDIDEKHYKESRELDKYREEQFDKALQLFVENIRDLWS